MHKTTIKVSGMYCSWCAEQLSKQLLESLNIKDIEMDIKNKTITIISKKQINKIELEKEILKKGYGPTVFLTNIK